MEKVEGRRLFTELKNILTEKNVLLALERINQFGFYPEIFPSLKYTPSIKNLLERIEDGINWYKLSYFATDIEEWLVYFMALAMELPSENKIALLGERLDLPDKRINFLREAKKKIQEILFRFSRPKTMLPSEIYHTLENCSDEELIYMMAKTQKEETKKAISFYLQKLRAIVPSLTGNDLKALNIEPGPIYKEILKNLLDARLNGELHSKEEEIVFVQEHFVPHAFHSISIRRNPAKLKKGEPKKVKSDKI